jgi:hypothetical protein
LIYGSQLVLPGQFVAAADVLPPDAFLETLKAAVDAHVPSPTRHNLSSTATSSSPLPPDLLHARLVFVRRDEAKPPLAASYAGPYRVLERSTTFFWLQVGEKEDVVATHCLKPAFLPSDVQPASPPRVQGRRVMWSLILSF